MLRKVSSAVDVHSVRMSVCVGRTGIVTSSVTRDRVTQSARDIVVDHAGLTVTMVTFVERDRVVMSQWTGGSSESIIKKKSVLHWTRHMRNACEKETSFMVAKPAVLSTLISCTEW